MLVVVVSVVTTLITWMNQLHMRHVINKSAGFDSWRTTISFANLVDMEEYVKDNIFDGLGLWLVQISVDTFLHVPVWVLHL